MAYDFHYTPTGTGVISGKEVLEQTEDAINDLGNTAISGVQEALDKAEQALTNSENAVDDAQNALNTANTAYTAATNAQNTANTAQNTASNALTAAQNAQNDVNALGNRVTTAEGNITQNTNAITGLTTRMGTAEGNIGNLQTAVSTAQATANSAQQTATTARQQSYVFRYSSTAVVPNSTVAYSTIDNTDNIKTGDKILDVDGKLFEITAVDTTNQTVTVGTALIDLALDGNVVHLSGTETVGGQKTFTNSIILQNSDTSGLSRDLFSKSQVAVLGDAVSGDNTKYRFVDKNDNEICYIRQRKLTNSNTDMSFCVNNIDNDNNSISAEINFVIDRNNDPRISPSVTDSISLGRPTFRWKSVYATNYYYGANNVEFSTKFVTTDTAQTITGNKTFSGNVLIYNSNASVDVKYLILKNQKVKRGSTTETGTQFITFQDKDGGTLVSYDTNVLPSGNTQAYINVSNLDTNSQRVVGGVKIIKTPTETWFIPDGDNTVSLGLSNYKWKDTCTNLINGLTPSSLGMPTDNIANIIDISGYITVLDGSSANTYQAPDNGYIGITMSNCTGIQAYITGFWGNQIVRPTAGALRLFMPICKNMTANILIFGGTINSAKFFPCQGNI